MEASRATELKRVMGCSGPAMGRSQADPTRDAIFTETARQKEERGRTESEHGEEEQPEHGEDGSHQHLADGCSVDALAEFGGDVGIVHVVSVDHVFQDHVEQT